MAVGRTALRVAAAGSLLALCGIARAEGLNAWLEPSYAHRETERTDQTGRTTETVELPDDLAGAPHSQGEALEVLAVIRRLPAT